MCDVCLETAEFVELLFLTLKDRSYETQMPEELPRPVKELSLAIPRPVKDLSLAIPHPVKDLSLAIPRPVKDLSSAIPHPVKDLSLAIPRTVKELSLAMPPVLSSFDKTNVENSKSQETKIPPGASISAVDVSSRNDRRDLSRINDRRNRSGDKNLTREQSGRGRSYRTPRNEVDRVLTVSGIVSCTYCGLFVLLALPIHQVLSLLY